MKFFGISKIQPKKFSLSFMTGVYFFLLLGFFAFFSLFSGITNLVFSDHKIDIFTKDLERVAFYFWVFDRDVSEFLLKIDMVVDAYLAGENVLQTREKELSEIWLFVKENHHYLKHLGFDNYEKLMEILSESYEHREEIFQLLGRDQPYNYLVLLQNGNEKRPNGGFFGSFAFVQLSGGHVTEMEIVDSYFPDFIAPNTRIDLPVWMEGIFPERQAGFVAGNKFGFTDIDGKNIKVLYEKIFNETYDPSKVAQLFQPEIWDTLKNSYIKGVLFINSRLMEDFFPGFLERSWEWQFLNASVDLIRGETRSNKKEFYLEDVQNILSQQGLFLVKNVVNHFNDILENQYVNLYVSNISSKLHSLFSHEMITNVYSPNKIYAWDINSAYNKSDAFVKKLITFYDQDGNLLFSSEKDILPFENFSSGSYRMQIEYSFYVPDYYLSFIRSLEEKYHISLTDREKGILVLQPVVDPLTKKRTWRETKGVLYFPSSVEIISLSGDGSNVFPFDAGFAHGIHYKLGTDQNDVQKKIIIDFVVK